MFNLVSSICLYKIALCPDLENPLNGVLNQSGVSDGDTATYSCSDGYELVGAKVLHCQNDGTWNNSPPVCKSELLHSFLMHLFFIIYS